MTTPAQKIQQKIKDYCKDNDLDYFKTIASSSNGDPDVRIVMEGITFYFEVKAPGDKLSSIQKYVISRLNRTSLICFVVDSYTDFLEKFSMVSVIIESITNKTLTSCRDYDKLVKTGHIGDHGKNK